MAVNVQKTSRYHLCTFEKTSDVGMDKMEVHGSTSTKDLKVPSMYLSLCNICDKKDLNQPINPTNLTNVI